MLTAAELAGMRSTAQDSLAGTAVIKTQTRSSDGGGGGTLAWTASGTADARLMARTPPENAEPTVGNRENPDSDWIVTLPAQTAVETTDRIEIQGKTFEVASVPDRTWEITKRILCREVT